MRTVCSESQLQTPEGCPVSANGIKNRRLQHRTEYYSTEEKQDRENSYEGKDCFLTRQAPCGKAPMLIHITDKYPLSPRAPLSKTKVVTEPRQSTYS